MEHSVDHTHRGYPRPWSRAPEPDARSFTRQGLKRRHPTGIVVMGVTILVVTVLHALEATIWAAAYWMLEALPDARRALLYSLSSMTSYGHANLYSTEHWQL